MINWWGLIVSLHTEFAPINNALFLDIETASLDEPELERYAQVIEVGKQVKYELEVEKAVLAGKRKPNKPKLKSDSPGLSPFTGRVVAIGVAMGYENPRVFYGAQERILLENLSRMIAMSRPEMVVTFNGEAFDLPFLAHRAMMQGVPELARVLPFSRRRPKFARVLKSWDIYEYMGGKWGINGTLDEYALWYGGQEHLVGIGYEVEKWWNDGDFGMIAKHCCGDVLAMKCVARKLAPLL